MKSGVLLLCSLRLHQKAVSQSEVTDYGSQTRRGLANLGALRAFPEFRMYLSQS
jgi:hypothetical protein